MKKLVFVLFILVLFFSINNVKAASITETKYENGRISINGTGEEELQIVLFGLDNLPIYLTTVTAEDNVFSITLPAINGLSEGNYTVKVSDYDGTNVSTDTVEITAETNPQTLDNIVLYVTLGIISLIGLIGIVVYIKKKI